MSWPLTEDALRSLGDEIVTARAGAVAGFEVAYGELTLTGPASRIVARAKFSKVARSFS